VSLEHVRESLWQLYGEIEGLFVILLYTIVGVIIASVISLCCLLTLLVLAAMMQ
jgi:hypothetical protein